MYLINLSTALGFGSEPFHHRFEITHIPNLVVLTTVTVIVCLREEV
jgi:hypothetical protein